MVAVASVAGLLQHGAALPQPLVLTMQSHDPKRRTKLAQQNSVMPACLWYVGRPGPLTMQPGVMALACVCMCVYGLACVQTPASVSPLTRSIVTHGTARTCPLE